MEPQRKRLGRPRTGRNYTERLMVYHSREGMERLARLAGKWAVSQAETVRRLIDEAARREGVD